MSETYVDAGRRDKDTWPRYLLGILLILFFWLIIGGVLSVVLILAFGGSLADVEEPSSLGQVQGFVAFMAAFPLFLAGIVLVVVALHRRGVRTLVTYRGSIDTKRIAWGFGLWFALVCLSSLVYFLLTPSFFSFGLDPAVFVPFALLALVLVPIQTTTEELFFRGYLVQGAALISRSPIFLTIVTAAVFMVPHLLNPEVNAGLVPAVLYYFAFGMFAAWISLKDGTTELAIGVHAANNLFGAVVLTFTGSVFDTPSIFYTDQFNPWLDLVVFLVMSAIFYLLIFVVPTRRPRG